MFGIRRLARRFLSRTGPRPVDRSSPLREQPPLPPIPSPSPDALGDAMLADLQALRVALQPVDRPLLVNHWATWCDGCVVELPLLVDLHSRWGGRVDFLGLSWDHFMPSGTPEHTLRQVQVVSSQKGLAWRNLVFTGTPEELFQGLGLVTHTIPQTSLHLPDGTVAWSREQPLDPGNVADLETVLRALLSLEPVP